MKYYSEEQKTQVKYKEDKIIKQELSIENL